VVRAGEAIATVGEHDCGWGMLRLRANGWDSRDRGQSSAVQWVKE
jgi:hypothetical protein